MTQPALTGKAAIVTGAGNGIGRAIATLFASVGAAVLCTDINSATVQDTAQIILRAGGRALALRCDVSLEADTRAAAEAAQAAFSRIDILVNAAATDDPNGTVVDIEPAVAIIQLAKAMAVDHAAQNIRVNSLSPGAVETQRLVLRFGNMETARRVAGPKHLLNRLGQPDEIAQAALFLAGDAASFMTGADMLVDGGYTTT
jgi:NAD(P)-dependent dehydrogenase (short-subunit alcohol dehydrogenase family)